MTAWDEQRLESLSRRQLQDLAKANNIRANLKSSDIIKQILSLDKVHDDSSETNAERDNSTQRPLSSKKNENSGKSHDQLQQSTEQLETDIQEQVPLMKDVQETSAPVQAQISNDLSEHETELDHDQASSNQDDDSVDKAELCPDQEQLQGKSNEHETGLDHDQACNNQADDFVDKAELCPDQEQVQGKSNEHETGLDHDQSCSNQADDFVDKADLCPDQVQLQGKSSSEAAPSTARLMRSSSAASVDNEAPIQELESSTTDFGAEDTGIDNNTPVQTSDLAPVNELLEPDIACSNIVQDALDTYRKIAIESSAELDAHGCNIPDTESSGKIASASTNGKQPAGYFQKKPISKCDERSAKTPKAKFDLQESLSRPISWEMKKGPLPPVDVQVLEDPNKMCLWSPSRMAERKTQFKNNEFGGTKRRLDSYMADGRSKLNETVQGLRKPQQSVGIDET